MRAWQSGRRRRGFGEQAAEVEVDDDLPDADDHEPLPSPVPLARRTRPQPVGEVVEQPDPLLDPIPDEGSWSDEWASGDWTVAETDTDDAPGRGPAEGAPDADNAAGSGGAGGLTSAGGSTADPRNATADPRTADPRSATADPRSVTPDPRGAAAVPHNSTADPRSATADPGSAEAVSHNPTPDPRGAVASPNPITGPPGTTPDLRKATSGPRGTDAGPAGPFAGPHDASQATPPTGLPSPTADRHPFGGPGADGGPATPHSVTAGPPTDVAGDARPSYPGAAPTDPADDTPVGSHALFTDQTPRPAAPAGALPPGPPPTPDTTPERATGNGPAHALAEPPTGPLPVVSGPMADALLKPEALARLSDADRELLTRLQAELAGGAGSPGPNGAAPA